MPTTYKVLGQTTSTAPAIRYLNAVWDPEFNQPNTTWSADLSTTGYVGYNGSAYWRLAVSSGQVSASKAIDDGYNNQNCYSFRNNHSGTSTGYVYMSQGTSSSNTPWGTNLLPNGRFAAFISQNVGKNIYFGFVAKFTDNSYGNSAEMRIDFFNNSTYLSSKTVAMTGMSSNSWVPSWNASSDGTVTVPSNATDCVMQIRAPYTVSGNTVQFLKFDDCYLNVDGYPYLVSGASNAPAADTKYVAPYTSTGGASWVTTTAVTTSNSTSATGWAGAGAQTVVYTPPTSTSAVVSSIVINNPNTTATTYRISVLPSGQTLGIKNFLAFDESIAANSSVTRTIGITLAAGDKLQISSLDTNAYLSASAFGSEIS